MLSIETRPKQFKDIKGQDNIITDIQNHLKDKSLPSVMIFSGESGTGKSSLSFLIAKLLNCKSPKKVGDFFEPCNECEVCNDINNEKFFRDTIYFNCGVKNKEDIKNLESKLSLSNKRDKYKIIILDEAQDFGNATTKATLLDFLERKRQGVYIIACTMDDKKLHKSIKQRGVLYKFKPLTPEIIARNLFDFLKSKDMIVNNTPIPEEFIKEGLLTIGNSCENSMRGAWQIFERCVYGKVWNRRSILDSLDIIDIDSLTDINFKLYTKDKSVINDLVNIGDLQEFFFKSRVFYIKFFGWLYTGDVADNDKWYVRYFEKFKSKLDINSLNNLLSIYSDYNNITFDKNSFILSLIKFLSN